MAKSVEPIPGDIPPVEEVKPPKDEEELPTEVPSDSYGDLTVAASALAVGDFIQARRTGENEPIEIAEGYVSGVAEGIIQLGTRPPYAEADGWRFELIRRDLVFPEKVSEIDAVLFTGESVVRLMGKGTRWTTEEGDKIDVSEIKSYNLVMEE